MAAAPYKPAFRNTGAVNCPTLFRPEISPVVSLILNSFSIATIRST
jgi:hypothetical protein